MRLFSLVAMLSCFSCFTLGLCASNVWRDNNPGWQGEPGDWNTPKDDDERETSSLLDLSCLPNWERVRPAGMLYQQTSSGLPGTGPRTSGSPSEQTLCWAIGAATRPMVKQGRYYPTRVLGWECCAVLATGGPTTLASRSEPLLADSCMALTEGGS